MVYSPLKAAAKYINHYIQASHGKGHGVHSPFLFELITRVMNDRTVYDDYTKVERLRKTLLKNKTILTIQDLGAGSSKTKSNTRTIASIAKNAAKPKKYGQLFYRMIKHYHCNTILELGTSLGLTAAYLALANPMAKVITLEGADAVAQKASENFKSLGIENIELLKGNFDDTLHLALQKMPLVDFAFIDGNHRQEPTLRYFEQLLPHTHNNTLLVFDDIHWSSEMETAWYQIAEHPAVSASIDLFFIGILSFRKEFKERRKFLARV